MRALLAQRVSETGPTGGGHRRRRRMETLGLVCVQLQPAIRRATERFDLELEFTSRVGLFVARIETSYPAVLLVDTELLGSLPELSSFAHSLRPDVKIFAVTWYWSEIDDRVSSAVDGVLHKPPRRTQWEAVLETLGTPRFSIPIPHVLDTALVKRAS